MEAAGDERAIGVQPLGRAWRAAYLAGGVVLFAVAFLFATAALTSDTGWSWLWAALAFALSWRAIRVLYASRRLSAISGADHLSRDGRPPVLYLRCFSDDSESGRFGGWYRMQHYTEEEQLASVLNQIGPFVAVGRPGESVANLGASRLYFKDDEWQGQVKDLMTRARLVVMRTGESDGLWWEIQQVLAVVPPEKLILLVDDEDELASFCGHLGKHLSVNVVSPPLKRGKIGSLRGVVVFRTDWSPRLLKVQRSLWRQSLRRPLEARLRMTLRPVFERLGAAWSQPPVSKSKVAFVTVGALMFLGFANSPDSPASDVAARATATLVQNVSTLPEFASSGAAASEPEQVARIMKLAQQGLRRLPDTVALERVTLIERMLNTGDETTCAQVLRGAEGPALQALYARMAPDDVQKLFGLLEVAAVSELRQVAVPAAAAESRIDFISGLVGHVPLSDRPRFIDIISRLTSADDRDACWAMRLLYRIVPLLPREQQVMCGRL